MVAMSLLKRVLPFLLTLIAGISLTSLLPSSDTTLLVVKDSYSACGHNSRYSSDAPLQITFKPETQATEEALRRNISGTVELSMVLHKNGSISDVSVVRGLPYGLNEEAIKAARGIKFIPAIVCDVTVDTIQYVEFDF